jgi:hypothetical protein
MIIFVPVHTAVWLKRALGELVLLIGIQVVQFPAPVHSDSTPPSCQHGVNAGAFLLEHFPEVQLYVTQLVSFPHSEALVQPPPLLLLVAGPVEDDAVAAAVPPVPP